MNSQVVAEELALELLARGESIRFIARGASMKPFVRDGDQVEVVPQGRVRVGDLVLLKRGDFGVVHRVVARVLGRFLIKGDNLPRADGWFRAEVLLGRVVAVRRDGARVPTRRVRALAWSAVTSGKRTRLVRRVARLRR